MQYLIDGYNLLFRLPKTTLSLQKKRERLIEELNHTVVSLNLQVTLIFDASNDERYSSTRSHYDAIEIVYTTKEQSADNYILSLVENSGAPHLLCVVTSDRDLANKSHLLGAKTIALQDFLVRIGKKRRKLANKSHKKEAFAEFKDSNKELARLLLIFEKKLLEDMTKDISN